VTLQERVTLQELERLVDHEPPAGPGRLDPDADEAQGRFRQYLVIVPATALSLTVMAFNVFGESLAERLDPRHRGC
jgi:hypothetical protein